jgi:putative mycofactocin binding protein MftB
VASTGIDLDAAWTLDPQVALRPERFGALAYHFGTRRLSFLKSLTLFDAVRGLGEHESARDALLAAGVEAGELPRYAGALTTLAEGGMIRVREEA